MVARSIRTPRGATSGQPFPFFLGRVEPFPASDLLDKGVNQPVDLGLGTADTGTVMRCPLELGKWGIGIDAWPSGHARLGRACMFPLPNRFIGNKEPDPVTAAGIYQGGPYPFGDRT